MGIRSAARFLQGITALGVKSALVLLQLNDLPPGLHSTNELLPQCQLQCPG